MIRTVCVAVLFSVMSLQGQVQYFSPQNIFRFADHLYESGDFLLAAGEYQRYAYLQGMTDSLRYRIALCRQRGGDPDLAMQGYQKIIETQPFAPLSDRARYQQAFLYTQRGDHRPALDMIEHYSAFIKMPEAVWRMRLLANLNRLHLRQWRAAETELNQLLIQALPLDLDRGAQKLRAVAVEGQKITYKSPALAGIMSAVVPGSGKMYAGRWNDGIYSLVLVGLLAYQSYDSFRDHGIESTKAWIYTSVGSVFYLGNIYGSVIAVKLGNQQKEVDVLAKIQVEIGWF